MINKNFKIGDRVLIQSKLCRRYDKKSGVIVNTERSDGFFLVEFDVPIVTDFSVIKREIFYPSELILLSSR